MKKKSHWQPFLILAVAALTIYNILPTLFYYLQPLKEEISEYRAYKIREEITGRVNAIDTEIDDWINSLNISLGLHPTSIQADSTRPGELVLSFPNEKEASAFRSALPRAVNFISFTPKKVFELPTDEDARTIRLQKQIPIHLTPEFVVYTPKNQLSFEELSGALSFDTAKIAQEEIKQLKFDLQTLWKPVHQDLKDLLVVTQEEYNELPADQKIFCFVLGSSIQDASPWLFVSPKGLDKIIKNNEKNKTTELTYQLHQDLQNLAQLLGAKGFILDRNGEQLHFVKRNFIAPYLEASREHWILDTQLHPMIPLSTVEQRLLAQNRIEETIHQELLKWDDEYRAATPQQIIPKPTKNLFLANLWLSVKKYFRGDDKKIIRWGLDLSGGKTVQIELQDIEGKIITDPLLIQQGINELQKRMDRLGVAEVSIRQAGHHVLCDFPGSQGMQASELIQGSKMAFHVVNEQFSLQNPELAKSVNQFLSDVWKEASAQHRTDPQHLQTIAIQHLYHPQPSEAAKMLLEQGLHLQNSDEATLCKIAKFRGDKLQEWQGQSHPLLIVFAKPALEGTDLEEIQTGYEPTKGNFLNFTVKSSSSFGNPRTLFFDWTSKYAKSSIGGTPLELFSQGRGWRMAVLLNNQVVSSPSLESPLDHAATISGHFSVREVQMLANDLKTGSLSFIPRILAEKNVSPELGKQERMQGIIATIIALLLVVASMIAYYRFSGVIASVAVLFNLLILWATLQNLGAALTLAGLAGVILTVGMAVDANVLVFERIKEEFAISGNIRTALSLGYKRAFSAILDSNLTTIIAAFILFHFDAGPIKSFAVNLMIGIVSSMFTALFVTQFYFNYWAEKPKNIALTMMNLWNKTRFNFLKTAKPAIAISLAIMAIGGMALFMQTKSILGMDFVGGYSVDIQLQSTQGIESYTSLAKEAFLDAGAGSQDVQIRELNTPGHLRLLFSSTMDAPSKPFGKTQATTQDKISWIIQSLEAKNLILVEKEPAQIAATWSAISGQMSKTMRNNALIGLSLALVAIFIYLSFRFEYEFAAAALICLIHDVLITMGAIGILHACGAPVQIDLHTIAALMTIIGYSLNDTIIIFDRIREEMEEGKIRSLTGLVNQALNHTLSRTVMTSGTTLLVLFALVLFGGASLFGFSLIMFIGILLGTASSWFIAAPILVFLHRKQQPESVQIT